MDGDSFIQTRPQSGSQKGICAITKAPDWQMVQAMDEDGALYRTVRNINEPLGPREKEMAALLEMAQQREQRTACFCTFDVDPFETDIPWGIENPWHFLRVCQFCHGWWWGLHCPHDGHQNACPHCERHPVAVLDKPEDDNPEHQRLEAEWNRWYEEHPN